jgi:hypothetical protein
MDEVEFDGMRKRDAGPKRPGDRERDDARLHGEVEDVLTNEGPD